MIPTITALEARRRIAAGAVLVDIRSPDEHARGNIPGARNVPLGQALPIMNAPEVIFHCKSGMRTNANVAALRKLTAAPAYLLEGGFDAWMRAGFDVSIDRSKPMDIMRQVQIMAGSLVLIGVIAGLGIAPVGFGLSAFIGAGLVFSGVSGTCGMGRLLQMMPWNRRRNTA